MTRYGRRRRGRGQHAQSMVEFALLAPVFMVILFLTIDFARLAYSYSAVSWAAREAARVVLGPRLTAIRPPAAQTC